MSITTKFMVNMKSAFSFLAALLLLAGCVREQPNVIVITATFQPAAGTPVQGGLVPTPSALPGAIVAEAATAAPSGRYVVQPGDTLSVIAAAQGVSVTMLVEANGLINPNALSVGQVLVIPSAPSAVGVDFRVLPDNRMVRAPRSTAFDVRAFVAGQPGYVRVATDIVDGVTLSAADIIERIAYEYSVDARLLLALLELRGGWLRNPNPEERWKTYPLGAGASPLGFDRNGLYRQLAWGADQMNFGYYRRKYANFSLIEFPQEGVALRFADGINPATAGVQYMLSQFNTYGRWQAEVSPSGLYATYLALFGDPFADAVESLTPPGLTQPQLALPFPSGQTWYFTGGPHGGWGAGSAWAAVDFAPPDDLESVSSGCYVSENFATAVAPGVIARTAEGVVVLDLDGDGDESTGWSILYLHIATQDRIAAGTVVRVGDAIGRPSCEGGFSNGTHIHLARRYNGEWIPADCTNCPAALAMPPFEMGGWVFYGYPGQEYQGYARSGSNERVADQGRANPLNRMDGG
jgi:LysM repeat protein